MADSEGSQGEDPPPSLVAALAAFAEQAMTGAPEVVERAAREIVTTTFRARANRITRTLSADEAAFLTVVEAIHALAVRNHAEANDQHARFRTELRRHAEDALRVAGDDAASVSKRELEVLQLIARGLRSKDIAVHLHISPRTVEAHTAKLMKKLGAKSQVVLLRNAITSKLLEP